MFLVLRSWCTCVLVLVPASCNAGVTYNPPHAHASICKLKLHQTRIAGKTVAGVGLQGQSGNDDDDDDDDDDDKDKDKDKDKDDDE